MSIEVFQRVARAVYNLDLGTRASHRRAREAKNEDGEVRMFIGNALKPRGELLRILERRASKFAFAVSMLDAVTLHPYIDLREKFAKHGDKSIKDNIANALEKARGLQKIVLDLEKLLMNHEDPEVQ